MRAPAVFDHVTHYYGGFKALDTLSLEVPKGSILALLGRNGAGKTTALNCLLGFQQATRGRIEVLGHDAATLPPEVRARVGFIAERQGLVGWMKVRDLVAFQKGSFAGFDEARCRGYLDRLGIPEKRRVRQLSNGMRAQLALALALAPHPELIILDDPALGLDAVVRREFLEVMVDLIQEEGRTLLFTSHILTDVERVADRIAILDGGVLRVNAPIDVLKERIRQYHLAFDGEAPEVPSIGGLVRARRRRDEMVLTVVDGKDVERKADELGAKQIESCALSLEDLFIDYTAGANS